MSQERDRFLGLDRPITRRDFFNGVAIGVGAGALLPGLLGCPAPRGATVQASAGKASAGQPPHEATGAATTHGYPPGLTGLRGSHEGSYATAHQLRDGELWKTAGNRSSTGESYDLVVIGGGVSGLSAAYYFLQRAGKQARVLILENHDDVGGHAKRNEFLHDGRLHIAYGGTQSLEAPSQYSPTVQRLMTDIGVDTKRFYTAFDENLYSGLGLRPGLFFDRETFGTDHLACGADELPWADVLAKAPLSEEARREIVRMYEQSVDYLPGTSREQKIARLAKLSYRDYLLDIVKLPKEALRVFQTLTHDLFGVGIDAVSALDCWALGHPGFAGLGVDLLAGPVTGLGRTPALHLHEEPYIFHFPDGGATVARLLLRALIPAALAGSNQEDSITARLDYARLDEPSSAVRVRLNSTAVQVRHVGDPATSSSVEVTYMNDDKLLTVTGSACVLACWSGCIPYLCPELPTKQKEALAFAVKVPLVYANVLIRDWTAFLKLGVSEVSAPGSYYSWFNLDYPVSLGEYRCPRDPKEPIVVHMQRMPCSPGLPSREQHVAGQHELMQTSFQTYELEVRNQLARCLGAGGFDPARDILALTVNRWPHGYAYEYNSLWDPPWPHAEQPCVVGRQRFGRVTIANADSAAYSYLDASIEQALRAVTELF